MAYDQPKSTGRRNPTDVKPSGKTANKASNQEQFTGTGARVMTPNFSSEDAPTYSGKQRNVGNQVKMAANPYGSNVLKDPMSRQRRKTLGAAENPSGSANRPGPTKAPGRGNGGAPSGFSK